MRSDANLGYDFANHSRVITWRGNLPTHARNNQQVGDQSLGSMIQTAQAGDARAYVQLAMEITPWLRNDLRRKRQLLDAAGIEDLVQNMLHSLCVARASYDNRISFMLWLFTIAR